jgi:cytochrome P450
MLRINSPVKRRFRMARVTISLGDVRTPAGSNEVMLLGATDRDGPRFTSPAEFDPDRPKAREHIAFGRWVRSCPGGPLVRAEVA